MNVHEYAKNGVPVAEVEAGEMVRRDDGSIVLLTDRVFPGEAPGYRLAVELPGGHALRIFQGETVEVADVEVEIYGFGKGDVGGTDGGPGPDSAPPEGPPSDRGPVMTAPEGPDDPGLRRLLASICPSVN